jgi:hypothetical protein
MPDFIAAWRALDARGIEEAGIVAHEESAGEGKPRQRLQSAGRDRTRAVRDAPSAFEEAADRWMRLVALEFLERAEIRIGIAESHDVPDRYLAVLEVVHE